MGHKTPNQRTSFSKAPFKLKVPFGALHYLLTVLVKLVMHKPLFMLIIIAGFWNQGGSNMDPQNLLPNKNVQII